MRFDQQSQPNRLIESLTAELERGVDIVRSLDDRTFTACRDGQGSIGAHIRHNLDFVNALLNGIAENVVDYDTRPRDARIENDRRFAMDELRFAGLRLKHVTPEMLSAPVMVKSEVDEEAWHTSSVSRELEFLHSHTVHHYALIARLAAAAGKTVDEEFGIAPSTLRYRAAIAATEYR